MKTYLTLDVGGSAIKYALLQEDLTILEKSSVPTPMDTLENFIETIGKIYDQFQDQIDGMALSMPGIIDPERGYQYTGGALRYIDKLETVEVLKKRCPTNITIGNDAKCAANAEIGFGNLQDIQDGAVVILGTGIGGCLIKDHKVHTGKHFSAGEFSFIKTNNLDPFTWNHAWCTRNGISGLLQRVQEALETDKEYTGIEIFEMANKGNEKVIAGIDAFAKEVATQIFNVHIIFDCEKVAIGGGISAQPLLIELINKNMNEIFDMMDEDKKVSYDKDYIEELYLRYMATGKSQEEHKAELIENLNGKTVLLIAPGKSSIEEKDEITSFLNEDVVTVSVNYNYPLVDTDYIFLSNLRRFRELDVSNRGKCIVTSNIPADNVYLQTKYRDLLCDIDAVKDNAGLMAIKFFAQMGVKKIYLAGFDGYSHDEKENYGESTMAFVTRTAVLDAMNQGMTEMLKKYRALVELNFLTKPHYVKI